MNCPVGVSVCLKSVVDQQVMVSLVRIPQKWLYLVVMVVNCPVGVYRLSPQQVMDLLVSIPHKPSVMVVNCPVGVSVCPYRLSPQQVMVLSVRIPHE